MSQSLQELMRHATRLTNAGRLNEATLAIQGALRSTVNSRSLTLDAPAQLGNFAEEANISAETSSVESDSDVLPASAPSSPSTPSRSSDVLHRAPGEFIGGFHTHASLTRRYKLFVPTARRENVPLIVMLHGCTQDPDDFAAGTGMNALGAQHGFCVLYPEQPTDANPSRCWNWFKHNHHGRNRGEAAVIATMTQRVIQERGIDAQKVYIAGLSAGGAMACLVAAAYPEVFAAVGVHSGLAPGVARSLPEGLAAMRGGMNDWQRPAGVSSSLPHLSRTSPPAELPVPAIVFHGDQDKTVHPRNGEEVVAAVLKSPLGSTTPPNTAPTVEHGKSRGRDYTRSTYRTATHAIAEHWILHGAGHAWSGGQTGGSHTDTRGPDASAEMVRFFSQTPRRVGG
jgi:poly(hydroxyalkanoate) depolymerase family esterase